jgi:protein gp37
MGKDSKIEWTHHTANLWWGCAEVHTGCDHCYARVLSHRWGKNLWGNDVPRREIMSTFDDLDKYQKAAKSANEIHRVFVGSMMDIFEKDMPLIDSKGESIIGRTTQNLRFHLFYRIDRGDYPNLLFLLLTKRPSNIMKMIFESWKTSPPSNVMYGTSPVDQQTADTLIPQLLKVPGKKFLSVEPQLDVIDLTSLKGNAGSVYQVLQPITNAGDSNRDAISWVIQGGESGHYKRPFNLEWARMMRDQCARYGVPYFFKQIDKIQEIPEDLRIREFPITVGK